MSNSSITGGTAPFEHEDIEHLDLSEMMQRAKPMHLTDRAKFFSAWIRGLHQRGGSLHLRPIGSVTDRITTVGNHHTDAMHPMLMFGSNSYLGLMSHPYVRQKMKDAIDEYGVGVSGSPLLNGRGALHIELEERIAALKGTEDALLFQSGYGANVGMLSLLAGRHDYILSDKLGHASFRDGMKMSDARTRTFAHNDVEDLERVLDRLADRTGEAFVGVEGVYSMDGDMAPLDAIAPICRKHGAFLIVDDAHGTGVTGPGGSGSASHFGVTDEVDIIMSTFSKTFGVTGAAVCTTRPIADWMRYYARSYVFSSSLPPASVAAVLGGLDVMEREPERVERLHHLMAYMARGLRQIGFSLPEPESAIIALRTPEGLPIREAIVELNQKGVFLNSIEYPAVPPHEERFRISLMATHTEGDIDRFLEIFAPVWDKYAPAEHRLSRSGPANLPLSGDGQAGPEPNLS
ncbi:MAG: aminotransferase class I/II-fold pyridoxal phosphate-dependent enzyme [Bacteroidota bacterium]